MTPFNAPGTVKESTGMIAPPKLTGARCRCGACGEHFNSVSVFDWHRAGPYRQSSQPADAPDRRCRTPDEMAARGWLRNDAGFWISRKKPAQAVTSRKSAAIDTDPPLPQGVAV